MYYQINGWAGTVVQYLEMPARIYFNNLPDPKCKTLADLVEIVGFIILGIPALIGVMLTKPIYWVKGEKIKQIDYNKEKKLWDKKMSFISPSYQQALTDCLIRLKIKADSCMYSDIQELGLYDYNKGMFYTYECEGRLTSLRDAAIRDEKKILGVKTFGSKMIKKKI